MAGKPKNEEIRKILTPEKLAEELKTMSNVKVAEKYNCSPTMIQRLKKEYGMAKKIYITDDKRRPKDELRIALIKYDLSFTKEEINNIKELWSAGIHFTDMVAYLHRHYLEVLPMVAEMLHREELQPRPNGVFGEVG